MEIPPRGTRGAQNPVFDVLMRLLRPMSNRMVARYRRTAGDEPPAGMGFPQVLLTTVGARTGQQRTSILGGFREDGDTWLVMASKGGAPTHPAWFFNLARHPDRVWLEVGRRKFKAQPELLHGAEREAALARIAGVAPRYGRYQQKTDREIPIVRLTPEA